jgi:plasmid stability protein
MTQLTVRGIDETLHQEIKIHAKERGLSVNRYVVELLREATGQIEPSGEIVVYHDLDHLAGTWSAEEADAFEQLLLEQRQVDEELWS